MKLAQLHKKQTLTIPQRKPAPPTASRSGARPENRPDAEANRPPAQPLTTLLMKWFTFIMAIGLVVTTVLGLYMSFKFNRDRRVVWGLLVGGTLLPLVIALA